MNASSPDAVVNVLGRLPSGPPPTPAIPIAIPPLPLKEFTIEGAQDRREEAPLGPLVRPLIPLIPFSPPGPERM